MTAVVNVRPACRGSISGSLLDGISGASSHTGHQTRTVDEAVDGDCQIQRSKSVRAKPPGDKQSIGQYIAGEADHPGDIEQYVFAEGKKK